MRRIKQISVTSLFGMFDHTIPLNLDERITIIHGPNGYGKTIVLTLVNDLFSARNSVLRTIPFDEIRINFDDNTSFWVTKTNANGAKRKEVEPAQPKVTLHSNIHGVTQEPFILKPISKAERDYLQRAISIATINRLIPEIEYLDRSHWRHTSSSEILTWEDLIERFSDRLPVSTQNVSERVIPDWVKEIRSSIDISFIQTQRLLNTDIPRQRDINFESQAVMVPTVRIYSYELTNLINSVLLEYGKLSQSLDRTFPARAFNPLSSSELTKKELQKKLDELENKRSRLTKAGLLDQDESEFQIYREIDERAAFMLSVYVEDVEQKLGVFDKIVNKIDLLTKIINKHFSYKMLSISKERGFVIRAESGTTLVPENLSSGEQHELVLLYELLFKVEPNCLILIDEPELSLHVTWQLEFLEDLQEITQLAEFDILIATHSPQIINDRWDLTVQLYGPNQ
jgi:predicted ATP-binding protein involved in virulence